MDRENERVKRVLRKQKDEEDFWDEIKEFQSEPSSDESKIKGCRPDEPSSGEDNPEVDNKEGGNAYE